MKSNNDVKNQSRGAAIKKEDEKIKGKQNENKQTQALLKKKQALEAEKAKGKEITTKGNKQINNQKNKGKILNAKASGDPKAVAKATAKA